MTIQQLLDEHLAKKAAMDQYRQEAFLLVAKAWLAEIWHGLEPGPVESLPGDEYRIPVLFDGKNGYVAGKLAGAGQLVFGNGPLSKSFVLAVGPDKLPVPADRYDLAEFLLAIQNWQ